MKQGQDPGSGLWMATLIVFGTFLTAGLQYGQVINFEFIDHPQGIGEFIKLWDLSADGSVIMGEYSINGTIHGFRWEQGAFMTLESSSGFFAHGTSRISRRGDIVLGWIGENQINEPYIWDFNKPSTERPIKVSKFTGEQGVRFWAISENNEILAGEISDSEDDVRQGCYWMNETLNLLPYLSDGDNWSGVAEISSDGSVMVGYSGVHRLSMKAVQWRNGMISKLEEPSEIDVSSYDYIKVSSDGSIIMTSALVSENGSNTGFLVRWTEGIPEILVTLPGTSTFDMSGDGKCVINSNTSFLQAFLASEDDNWIFEALNDILDANEIDREGFSLYEAAAISADGTTIIGESVKFLSDNEFLLRPYRIQFMNETYGPYEVLANGYCDTTPWLNWLWVEEDPWVLSVDLNHWLYCPGDTVTESGAWVYIPR